MTEIIKQMAQFEGRMLIEVCDEIDVMARNAGYSVNVIDPMFNTAPIDKDPHRLNVRTNLESRITSFSIG